MQKRRPKTRIVACSLAVTVLAGLLFVLPSCRSQDSQGRRTDTELKPGWPKTNDKFRQASLPEIRAEIPTIAGAEYVNDDELCMQCHQAYAESMQHNVHRGIHKGQACEACHGPASRHLETRGREPGLILNFKKMQPAQASEACIRCHEQDACAPGSQWRLKCLGFSGQSNTLFFKEKGGRSDGPDEGNIDEGKARRRGNAAALLRGV